MGQAPAPHTAHSPQARAPPSRPPDPMDCSLKILQLLIALLTLQRQLLRAGAQVRCSGMMGSPRSAAHLRVSRSLPQKHMLVQSMRQLSRLTNALAAAAAADSHTARTLRHASPCRLPAAFSSRAPFQRTRSFRCHGAGVHCGLRPLARSQISSRVLGGPGLGTKGMRESVLRAWRA